MVALDLAAAAREGRARGLLWWKPYVPVAKRRQQAAACVQKFAKKGLAVEPVIVGRPDNRQNFLGQVLVRKSRTLQ